MKIRDILAKGKPAVSFEVFPPKADAPFEPIQNAVVRLALQNPSFMSVTYGAAGNAQVNTVAIASFVQSVGVSALAHLTCVAASRDKIAGEIASLRAAGIENVLCLRGDLPKDGAACPPAISRTPSISCGCSSPRAAASAAPATPSATPTARTWRTNSPSSRRRSTPASTS